MRTKNEKTLLVILAIVVFAMANYFGYRWLAQRQSSLQMTAAELRADQAEANVDLLQSSLWSQRREWIKAHQPLLGDEGESKAQVLAYVLKGARDNKLEILDQSLNDAQQGPAGTCINVSVKVKGSMQGMCRWLADFQKPDQFYAVPLFSLKADQDQKSMVCMLQLARYFKDGP